MYSAKLNHTIDSPWTNVDTMRVGNVPKAGPTPDAIITITKDGVPFLRIDAFTEYGGPFTNVTIWDCFVVLGWNDCVHLIDPDSREVLTIQCDGYFGGLYPQESMLLIASATDLICVDQKGHTVWRTERLAIDGVVVNSITKDGIISGEGEWDPPGGWKPFRASLATGERLSES